MLPGVYGFKWEMGNLIFLGVFYSVLTIISGTIIVAISRALKDFRNRRQDVICWKADFEDLPRSARTCRHVLTGEFKSRTCPNSFDCRECVQHARMAQQAVPGIVESPSVADAGRILGVEMPLDRLYHRGHTWVHEEPDGSVTVGLDDFASRLIGAPDDVSLPAAGEQLLVNGTGWQFRKGTSDIRILAPVDGTVLETGGPGRGWYLKVAPPAGGFRMAHLLRAHEVQPWILRELERLQFSLSNTALGPSLADGGFPVDDPSAAYPEGEWDLVWGDIFLQP
jgi:hypothetical protein